jgi:hypothetical protein
MGRIIGLVSLILLIPAMCFAQPKYCLSSGEKTAAHTSITTTGAKLCGVIIRTDETNDVTAVVYDKAATNCDSGTKLFDMTVTGTDDRGGAIFAMPISAINGLCLALSGDGTESAVVYYQP